MGSFRIDRLKGHPRPGWNYVLGCDAAGGTGNDEAAIIGLTLETFEQVFEFGSNRIDPVDFGHFICHWGNFFNEAWIVCEGNNHGIATHSILKKNYSRMKLYKRNLPMKGEVQYGYYTGETTKKAIVGYILEGIENGLTLYGPSTCKEMNKFIETPSGQMGAAGSKKKSPGGTNIETPQDGKVIALGLACCGWFKWKHLALDLKPKPAEPKIDYGTSVIRIDAFEWMQQTARRGKVQKLFPRQVAA